MKYSVLSRKADMLAMRYLCKNIIVDFAMNRLHDEKMESAYCQEFLNNAFVAGGFFANYARDQHGDFDIFLKDADFAKKFYKHFEDTQSDFVIVTDNAITFLNDTDFDGDIPKIQVIIKWTGEPRKVCHKFDFMHLQSYYDYATDHLILRNSLSRLRADNELRYTGSEYPLSTYFRLEKFINKGYTLSNKGMSRLIADILKLDLSSKEKIKEQCTGLYDDIENVLIFNILGRR